MTDTTKNNQANVTLAKAVLKETTAVDTTVKTPVVVSAAPPVQTVPANPALVEWPRDEWGSLSNLRRELLLAASNIRGNADKHELFIKTLQIAAMHAAARLAGDKAALEAELVHEAQRIERSATTGRAYGQAVG